MDNDWWLRVVWPRSFGRTTSNCLVLTPDCSPKSLQKITDSVGIKVLPTVSLILGYWREKGSQIFFDSLPRHLNPDEPEGSCDYNWHDVADLFPDLSAMLHETKEIAVLVDLADGGNLIVAGVADQPPKAGSRWPSESNGLRPWAYYMPQPISVLCTWEAETRIRLTPQMKQWYACVGGAPYADICPYISGPINGLNRLEQRCLYTEIYREIADEIRLSEGTREQLQRFVALAMTPTGDFHGFFPGEYRDDGECPVWLWDHEVATFVESFRDFAAFVHDQIGGDVANF